jgi:hypothetical protein
MLLMHINVNVVPFMILSFRVLDINIHDLRDHAVTQFVVVINQAFIKRATQYYE